MLPALAGFYSLAFFPSFSFFLLSSFILEVIYLAIFFPGGASGKEPSCQCSRHKDSGSVPGSGRSSGEGNGYPLQYSCLNNPMDRGA